MTLSCSSTDLENDSDFRPSCAVLPPQIQVMPPHPLRISFADYVQLLLQAGFIQRRRAIRHPYHHVNGDSRLIRRPSVAIVRSPNTCATTVFREPVMAA